MPSLQPRNDTASGSVRNLAVTANTYTHVLADEREVDYSRASHRDPLADTQTG